MFDDGGHAIFHCDGCGICRRGSRDEFFHCDVCGCCCAVASRRDHKCFANVTKRDCPVCLSDLHSGREAASFLKCGHALHVGCLRQLYAAHSTVCPLCKKSLYEADDAVTAQYDAIVAATPMPGEYASWRATVSQEKELAQ